MTADRSGIHDEHPFADPPEERDPVRQFRGRLVAPVTIVTAGGPGARVGMTVSSLMVAEGLPARAYFLVGSATDLYDAIVASRRFVVHALGAGHREVSDVFAGLRPSPGGMFAGLDVVDGPYGPELAGIPNRLYCKYAGGDEATFHVLATGVVERVEVADLPDPLVYYRGRYRKLA